MRLLGPASPPDVTPFSIKRMTMSFGLVIGCGGGRPGSSHSVSPSKRQSDPSQNKIVDNTCPVNMKMTITTAGNQCTLEVRFTLKPGFTDMYVPRADTGEMSHFTLPRTTQTSCEIF